MAMSERPTLAGERSAEMGCGHREARTSGGLSRRSVLHGAAAIAASGYALSQARVSAAAPVPTFPPAPRYEVTLEPDVRVRMRDGVDLSTDVYRPVGLTGKLPTVLIRTLYDKDPYRPLGYTDRMSFAAQGFALVVQDLRGKFESGGDFSLGDFEASDGYDTLSWIASQPWSNGRVGTYGCSALGITQVLTAQTLHPAHKCAIAQGSIGSRSFVDSTYGLYGMKQGGVAKLGYYVPWFYQNTHRSHSRQPQKTAEEFARAIATLPSVDILKKLGSGPTDYEEWHSRDPADPWFDRIGFLRDDSIVDVPTLFIDSWYDIAAADALQQWRTFKMGAKTAEARRHQHIILSPATHCRCEELQAPTVIGDRELGDARFPFRQTYLNWFDAWLNDKPDRIEGLPPVQYYAMGRNEWRSAPDWPPPGVQSQRWYLRSGGNAKTRIGNGRLEVEPPPAEEPADTYTYDPGNPTPAVVRPGDPSYENPVGSLDHSELELREDVLCFTSAPLERGLEVTGDITAVLYVSSSAPDTDFFLKLLDVYPDGRAFDCAGGANGGILRVRYREGFDRQVMMEPGKVYRIEISLEATSNWFAPGHRIRLQISSAMFPRFERNLNTGGNNWDETEWAIAQNTVHHSLESPSYVLLPIAQGGI